MTLWVFYRTDGDSGWYAVKLFRTKAKAEAWNNIYGKGYGEVREIEVTE